MERGDDSSYHSNMFNLEESGQVQHPNVNSNSADSKSGESLDKIYRAKNFKKQNEVIPGLNGNSMDQINKVYTSHD